MPRIRNQESIVSEDYSLDPAGSKKIPPKYEEVITDRKERKQFEVLVHDLANFRETRKELEDGEKEAKTKLQEFRERYGFDSLYVGQLKIAITDQTRESLSKGDLINYLMEVESWPAAKINKLLEAATKVSTFQTVRVSDIPKGELE